MASRDQRRQTAGAPPGGAPVAPADVPAPSARTLGRRHVLGAAGVTAVSLAALAPAARAQAQNQTEPNTQPPGSTPGSTPGRAPAAGGEAPAAEPAQVEGPDLVLVRFARSVEVTLVDVYEAAVESGRLRGAALDQANTFKAHHEEQAEALAEIAGSQAPNDPNRGLLSALLPRVEGAGTELALIAALGAIEENAAATYLSLLGDAEDWQLATTFATIGPVDAQHAVAWNRLVFPEAQAWAAQIDRVLPFNQTTDGAWSPAQYPVGPA